MLDRIRHMLAKEFIQVLRDPRMRAVIFLMPVIQLLVFSYAVTTDVRHIAMGVLDHDNSGASRETVARFSGSGYFDIRAYPTNEKEIDALLNRGTVSFVLRINKGYESDLLSGRGGILQVLVDGTDSNTAGVILAYSASISQRLSQEHLGTSLARNQGTTGQLDAFQLQTRAWFNENFESRNYYIPGLLVLIVTLITLLLTSMAVVREKEIGTMEQIMVTPIRPMEFILGKTVPFAIIGYIDVVLVIAVARFWFHVPLRGSLPLLFFGMTLFLLTTLGIGLLISTISATQQEAMMTTFFFFMPAILLSGFMFPIANMPEVIQWVTFLNPLRYFLVIVRGLFLKGIGFEILWPQYVGLAVIGVTTLLLATGRFKKTYV